LEHATPGSHLGWAEFYNSASVGCCGIDDDDSHEDDTEPGEVPYDITDAFQADIKLEAINQHLELLVEAAVVPHAWTREGVDAPSRDCRRWSTVVLQELFRDHGIIPYKVTASKEGGIFAVYQSPHSNRELRLEVDNDLDAVAVISSGNQILESGVVSDDDDFGTSLIATFQGQLG
jgi:hypothetical protein